MNVCALLSLSVLSAKAQTTYMEMEQLTVNDQVTTVITASEAIRFVESSDCGSELLLGSCLVHQFDCFRVEYSFGA